MSDARDEIFERLRGASPPSAPDIVRVPPPEMPADAQAVLRSRVEQAGGRLQEARRAAWPGEIEWPCALASVEHLYVSPGQLEGLLPSRGAGSSARRVHDLAPLEVCVVAGAFAVVENGAVWQRPTSALERAAILLATHLLVLVEADQLVPSLHQAYPRIELELPGFGWFLSGPSKTADIEQALVLGAHGPRTMSLVLLRE